MHETDYNLMLLRKLGIRVTARRFEPTITVDADAKERMRELIKTEGFELNDPFVVVHPGMGGSALNWPEGYYVDMVRRLITGGVRVLVSGSTNEKAIIERVFDHAKGTDTGLPLHKYIGELTDAGLSDYIALISLSKVMVAPSTGPLHIATALGKRTVSFYPPVKVQSVLRWGPYSGDENRHITLVPDAICGQDYKCIGPKCSFYFCMERLAVDEAYHNVLNQLESAKNESIDQKTG
jgi:ADP-heptose:LPS heptosyltransferase